MSVHERLVEFGEQDIRTISTQKVFNHILSDTQIKDAKMKRVPRMAPLEYHANSRLPCLRSIEERPSRTAAII